MPSPDATLRSSAWADVDASADANSFVGYLDTVTAHEAVRAYKRQTYAMLDIMPGHRLLDVGCGAGDDAIELARLVGPSGEIVGIDAAGTMVDEASRRAADLDLPVTFQVGDAHQLAFADVTFDGCRADRVFQHLDDPRQALGELMRVTKPGGAIVVVDPDWGTLVVDAPDRALTQRIVSAVADSIRNPWLGRQLPGLFHEAGLVDITVAPTTAVVTDYAEAEQTFQFTAALASVHDAGEVSDADARSWTQALAEAARGGRFFSALTAFLVAGRLSARGSRARHAWRRLSSTA